jgi:hypothetical protein
VTRAGHGTAASYRNGCLCAPCRYAASKARRSQVPHGDRDAVVEHLRSLSAAGLGYRRVGELAGVWRQTVYAIIYEGARPMGVTARKLLAVTADMGPSPRWTPALGTVRQLRGLRSLGWTSVELGTATGSEWHTISQIALGRRETVRPGTATAVADVYTELAWLPPPASLTASRGRSIARKSLWFPPLAWDDDTIDDPAALPCLLPPVARVAPDLELLVQHVVAGHPVEPTPEVRAEIVRRMRGRSLGDIAAAARCSVAWAGTLRTQLAGRSA